MNVNAADVMRIVKDPGATKLVDVRTPQEYDEGHIPGAINLPYPMDPPAGSDVAADQVAAYEAAGMLPDDPIVLYCTSGIRAQKAADILTKAGYHDVNVYPGSWMDWISDPARPTER